MPRRKKLKSTRLTLDSPLFNIEVSPANFNFVKNFFRLIFALAVFISVYSLYVLDNLTFFFVSASFSLTIFILYLITFTFPSLRSAKPAFDRLSAKSKSNTRSLLFPLTLFFTLAVSVYFLFYRPVNLNPYARLEIKVNQAFWDTTITPPQFVVSGQVNNNNSFDVANLKLNIRVFSQTDYQSSLSQADVDVPVILHNNFHKFRYSFDSLPSDSELGYAITIKK